MEKISIALDVDDVVADWTGYAKNALKYRWADGERLPSEKWDKLKTFQRMYMQLELKEGARELVSWCSNYADAHNSDLYFLTAIPKNIHEIPMAISDKVHWCNAYFPRIPVMFGPYSQDKYKYCTGKNSILIDDRLSNITQWIDAGGRAHQYKNWETCKEWLENILRN